LQGCATRAGPIGRLRRHFRPQIRRPLRSAACAYASAIQVPNVGMGAFVTCCPIPIYLRSAVPMAATKSSRLWHCLFSGLLVALQLSYTSAASKVCFDHNGNQLTTDDALPCEPDSKSDGPCCAPGTICLSNGLCKSPNTRVNNWYDTYKPTCTDGTWTTENCFDGCNGCE
jgi:hypothetical protein